MILSKKNYGANRVHYEVADACNLPFDRGFFDLVVCTEALELIPDAEKVIEEIQRVLKRGGHIIISTPNYLNLIGILKKRRDRILKSERWNPWGINIRGGFERHFTPPRLKRLLKGRFKILTARGADYILSWLFWSYLVR